jgi:hypothetical protein
MIPIPHPAMKSQGIKSGQLIGDNGVEHISFILASVTVLPNHPVEKTGRRYIAAIIRIPNMIGTALGL